MLNIKRNVIEHSEWSVYRSSRAYMDVVKDRIVLNHFEWIIDVLKAGSYRYSGWILDVVNNRILPGHSKWILDVVKDRIITDHTEWILDRTGPHRVDN